MLLFSKVSLDSTNPIDLLTLSKSVHSFVRSYVAKPGFVGLQMRIVKLAQSWGTMRTLLAIIFQTMGALGNLTAILLLIMFIFAVLGNQLLGEPYEQFTNTSRIDLADFGGELPRWVACLV